MTAVFAGLFLLLVGALMVGGTLYGLSRGRVMTLRGTAGAHRDLWARRGESGFWLYAACWLGGGMVVLHHAFRLMLEAVA